MSRMLALKTDAGSGALEQMVLAEYCAPHFATHVPKLTRGLRAKLDTLMEALNEQFGTSAEFEDPKGGIFLWVKLPDNVDTLKLYQAALAAGVAINPGPEWSTDKAYAGSRLRLCFASPSHEQIREGVAVLADVCRKEFGVPERSANVEKRVKVETQSKEPAPSWIASLHWQWRASIPSPAMSVSDEAIDRASSRQRSAHRERRLIGPAERHAVDHGLHRLEQTALPSRLLLRVSTNDDRRLDQLHDRDVAGRADLQRADFRRAVDDLGRRRGRHRHHLLQRKARAR